MNENAGLEVKASCHVSVLQRCDTTRYELWLRDCSLLVITIAHVIRRLLRQTKRILTFIAPI